MRSRLIRFANLFTFAVVCGLILGTFLAARAQGGLRPVVMGTALAAWDTLLLASIALVAHIINAKKLVHLCIIGTVAGLVQMCVFATLGYTNYLQQENDVQEYGQAIVYLLEQHRAQHGRYPATFNPATVRQPQPRRAEDTILYYSTGDRFLLTFLRPTQIDNFWVYDSAEQHWSRSPAHKPGQGCHWRIIIDMVQCLL